MEKRSETSEKLAQMIKRAMNDLEITTSEYNAIMDLAQADGHVDSGEQKLLSELQTLIANGTIKRVKG